MKRTGEAATRQRILEFGQGLGIKLRRTTSYQNYGDHLPLALMAWPTTDRKPWSARRQRGCLGAVRPNRKQASAMLSQLNKGEDWVEAHRPPTEGRGGRSGRPRAGEDRRTAEEKRSMVPPHSRRLHRRRSRWRCHRRRE